MSASAIELAGALLACGAAAAALLVRDPRARYAAIGLSLIAAVGLIAGDVWHQPRFEDLRSQPGAVALGLILAGIALAAAAATFVRVPAAFAIAAVAVLSLRIPVQVGGETNFLLVPLYGVIAGGWLRGAWLIYSGRGEELQQAGSPRVGQSRVATALCAGLAGSLVVYGVGVAWSGDPTNALRTVAFFLAPFAALFALLRDLRWHRKLFGWVLIAIASVGGVLAVIALTQYWLRELILNEDLKAANQLHMYFRTNGLFRDPNVLGRYLAFAIVALAAWFAWRRSRTETIAGALLAALILAALAVTFSQTSFMALIAGLGTLVWLRLGWKGLAAAAAMVAVAGAIFIAGGGTPASDLEKERNELADVTSGRADLISGGIELFERRPLAGWGSGSFAISFRQEIERIRRPVSHNEPITVAAEQGIIGLIPFAIVLGAAALMLLTPWPGGSAARSAIAACFAALLVHTMGYAGFFGDPAMWVLLALGLVLRE